MNILTNKAHITIARGGTPGMIEGFFGFEIFNSGIFLVAKFGKYFFGWLDLSREFFGCSKQSKDLW